MKTFMLAVCITTATLASALAADNSKVLKAGIIGLDTSHVTAFTGIINRANPEGPLAGVKVVAAFPAGSPDLEISSSRIDNFTRTLRDVHGVEIVDSIDALLKKVDVVLLESVDGRPHLEQARPVILAGKPLFIDKPIAASLADTIEIFELAKKHNVPCFSSSSLRFGRSLQHMKQFAKVGKIQRVDAFGSVNPLPGHPDLFFYGIHGIEMLFAFMGSGCTEVTWQEDGLVKGVWNDGRIGTFRKGPFKLKVIGSDGSIDGGGNEGYVALVEQICKFFKTGKAPVAPEETINLIAYMTAAQQSKDNGHVAVAIDDVMKQARERVAARQKSE